MIIDNRMGGAIGIMIRKFYQTIMIKSIDLNDSQCINVKIISNSIGVTTIFVIYRLPNSHLTNFLSYYFTS